MGIFSRTQHAVLTADTKQKRWWGGPKIEKVSIGVRSLFPPLFSIFFSFILHSWFSSPRFLLSPSLLAPDPFLLPLSPVPRTTTASLYPPLASLKCVLRLRAHSILREYGGKPQGQTTPTPTSPPCRESVVAAGEREVGRSRATPRSLPPPHPSSSQSTPAL
eukprot:Hpha_TRINITY_DN15522_c1_g6::TRINITY_DN15522_c1_g6_i3::g.108118::m.108118